MSLLQKRNEILFKKIEEDYKSSGKTLEYCCNKNGITSRTYYNIRKRMNGKKTSKTTNTLFTTNSSKKSAKSRSIRDSDVELITSKPKKTKSSSKSSKNISDLSLVMKDAADFLNS